ncbi:MAG: dicarboxylate/amino acid:cation symporter [Proteobacteria bacterium]|nr:dicarboxylate/amino acid:cation symporter [Pseudomonadota bacterium]
MNLSIRILLGLALGLVLGVYVSISGGDTLTSIAQWIEPFGTLWVNAIRMTVIPLLMSLLITSIAGQKNTQVAAKLGGKTLLVFFILIVISSGITFMLAPMLLSLLSMDAQSSKALLASTGAVVKVQSELPAFSVWFTSLIPTNPVAAAANNAILPLLIFTSLFAAALLKVESSHREIIVGFFEAMKRAMFVLIEWIMLAAPFGVFALVFPLSATLGFEALTALASFILIACGLIVAITLLLYPLASIVGKLPLIDFIRFCAPVQVIGFSTRSSLASLPATIDAAEKLGIPTKVSGVVLPIAVTVFKFASPIARTAGTYFIANLYGIELSVTQMLVIAVAIGMLSFYSPGIPSGGLLIMSPIYHTLGLPIAGIGILIAVDLIIDMFITASNVTANITVAAIISRHER